MGSPAYGISAALAQQNSDGSTSINVQAAAMMANQQYQAARTSQISGKKVTVFGSIKKYFDDHRDLLMTLAVLVIVDQWVFDGAFKEKIKGLIDRVVGHAESKVKALETQV